MAQKLQHQPLLRVGVILAVDDDEPGVLVEDAGLLGIEEQGFCEFPLAHAGAADQENRKAT